MCADAGSGNDKRTTCFIQIERKRLEIDKHGVRAWEFRLQNFRCDGRLCVDISTGYWKLYKHFGACFFFLWRDFDLGRKSYITWMYELNVPAGNFERFSHKNNSRTHSWAQANEHAFRPDFYSIIIIFFFLCHVSFASMFFLFFISRAYLSRKRRKCCSFLSLCSTETETTLLVVGPIIFTCAERNGNQKINRNAILRPKLEYIRCVMRKRNKHFVWNNCKRRIDFGFGQLERVRSRARIGDSVYKIPCDEWLVLTNYSSLHSFSLSLSTSRANTIFFANCVVTLAKFNARLS